MKKISVFFLIIVLLMSQGCSKQEVIGSGEQEYNMYFRSNTINELINIPYKTNTKSYDTQVLIEELWKVFSTTTLTSAKTTVTDAIILNRMSLNKKTLSFYFESNYSTMDTVTELLFRAALVKTFAQSKLSGVNNVEIYVAEQPLMNKSGKQVGKMSESDFVGIGSTDINSVRSATLSLYFTNKTGDKLVRKDKKVVYHNNFSLEHFVVELLIEGPEDEGYYATLPSDLKVISVSVKDGVCYVNFDSTFIDAPLTVQSYIPIYSVVNSLIELPNVRKVQILINGNTNVKFKDTFSFAEPFDMNLDYVETIKNTK